MSIWSPWQPAMVYLLSLSKVSMINGPRQLWLPISTNTPNWHSTIMKCRREIKVGDINTKRHGFSSLTCSRTVFEDYLGVDRVGVPLNTFYNKDPLGQEWDGYFAQFNDLEREMAAVTAPSPTPFTATLGYMSTVCKDGAKRADFMVWYLHCPCKPPTIFPHLPLRCVCRGNQCLPESPGSHIPTKKLKSCTLMLCQLALLHLQHS